MTGGGEDGRFLCAGAVAVCPFRAGDVELGGCFRGRSGHSAGPDLAFRPRLLLVPLSLGILQDIVFRIRRWIRPKVFLEIFPAGAVGAVYHSGGAGRLLRDRFCRVDAQLAGPVQHFRAHHVALAWPAAVWGNNLLAADSASADLVRMDYHPSRFPPCWLPAGMLGLVVVMSAWKGRLYCNTVCPVGALLGLLSRVFFSGWVLIPHPAESAASASNPARPSA